MPSRTNVLDIATKKVISVNSSATVNDGCKTLLTHGIRRVPVVDEENVCVGIFSVTDALSFFGAGEKTRTLVEKCNGEPFKGLSLPITDVASIPRCLMNQESSALECAQQMLECHVGGVPVVDSEKRILGMACEKDLINYNFLRGSALKIKDIMSRGVVSARLIDSLDFATKSLIKNHFRRLFVMDDEEMKGILRSSSILKFFSKKSFEKFELYGGGAFAKFPVSDAMSDYFYTVHPEESILDLAEIMEARRTGGLAVEGEKGKIIGVVTEHDIFQAIYCG